MAVQPVIRMGPNKTIETWAGDCTLPLRRTRSALFVGCLARCANREELAEPPELTGMRRSSEVRRPPPRSCSFNPIVITSNRQCPWPLPTFIIPPSLFDPFSFCYLVSQTKKEIGFLGCTRLEEKPNYCYYSPFPLFPKVLRPVEGVDIARRSETQTRCFLHLLVFYRVIDY